MSQHKQSKEISARKAIRRWEIPAEAGKKNEGGENRESSTSTINYSATTNILQNNGDEGWSKVSMQVQPLAELIKKIAKHSEDDTITEKRSKFQQGVKDKLSKLVPFGPSYGGDSDPIQLAKQAAWDHIVHKGGPDADTERTYKLSVKDIEDTAMEIYKIPYEEKPKPEQFRQMMVKDGCFFLQLALHILGGVDLLKYPSNHTYFGETAKSSDRIPDMFFMGNQIPYDVLQALMKQTFFKDVINEGIQSRKWSPPDETDFEKTALYLTVVKPAFWSRISEKPPPHFIEPPSNILECLHNLFLGNRAHDPKGFKIKEFEKLEAGTNDDDIKIPSAGELSKLGIKLAPNKIPGIRNIYFQDFFYCAKLYLPILTIQTHTNDILTQLLKYEQNLDESAREVTAYLRFMRDLVRTYDDFKILEDKNIIQVKDENMNIGTIIRMFDDLVTIHSSNFTLNFLHVRRRITDYGGPPWRLISYILGILTVIQTVFTVLSYIRPLK